MPGARQEQIQPQGREAIKRPLLPSTPKTVFADTLSFTRRHFSDQQQPAKQPEEPLTPSQQEAARRAIEAARTHHSRKGKAVCGI